MIRKKYSRIFILLFTLIFIISGTVAVFATQTVEYTTNGNAHNYVAGSVLVLYGKVVDGGKPIPNTTVTVDIQDSASKVIYYGQLKTDSSGYFKTNFTIPSGVTGSMIVKISTLDGIKVNDSSYTLSVEPNVVFTGYLPKGYQGLEPVTTIPASTTKLGLVFSGNVNYFNNKNNNLNLASLGVNERNRDCVDLYEKNSLGNFVLVSSHLDMATSDTAGNNTVTGITYIPGASASDKKDQRKDILYVVPDNGLKANTTYKVVIDGDLSANNSATLGTDVVVFFTTAVSSTGSSTGSSTVSSPSTVPTVKAESVGTVSNGLNTASLSVDSTKAANILKDAAQKALSIDLSSLSEKQENQVNVTLPAKVLAEAKTENKPVILNYGEYVMVIPPGSLPIDKELILEAKPAGTPSSDGKPDALNGLEQFEFSAKDSNGNDVAFNSNLQMEFDIPDNTINPQRLCVYFIDDKTGEWIYAGGRIVNGKLSFLPEHYSTYVIAESTKTFSDISTHWAKESIEAMVARQISKGISDNLFAPNQSITRAEFAVLIARALGLDTSTNESNPFSDVAGNAWYAAEVSKVTAINIVTGDNGKFRPNDNISRQEMAVMLSRAYSYTGTSTSAAGEISYTDKGSIASWAYNGVTQMSNLKMMSGYPDGSFGGTKNSTRAEATKTLKAFMDTLAL